MAYGRIAWRMAASHGVWPHSLTCGLWPIARTAASTMARRTPHRTLHRMPHRSVPSARRASMEHAVERFRPRPRSPDFSWEPRPGYLAAGAYPSVGSATPSELCVSGVLRGGAERIGARIYFWKQLFRRSARRGRIEPRRVAPGRSRRDAFPFRHLQVDAGPRRSRWAKLRDFFKKKPRARLRGCSASWS